MILYIIFGTNSKYPNAKNQKNINTTGFMWVFYNIEI